MFNLPFFMLLIISGSFILIILIYFRSKLLDNKHLTVHKPGISVAKNGTVKRPINKRINNKSKLPIPVQDNRARLFIVKPRTSK